MSIDTSRRTIKSITVVQQGDPLSPLLFTISVIVLFPICIDNGERLEPQVELV